MRQAMRAVWAAFLGCGLLATAASAEPAPLVEKVAAQPLKAQAKRLAEALQFLGQPLDASERAALVRATDEVDEAKAVRLLQEALDPRVLAVVQVNPESRVKAARGPAAARLHEQGWSLYLIKVVNEAGVTAPLRVSSPNAAPVYQRSTGSPDPKPTVRPQDVGDRWLDVSTFDQQPLVPALSGLEVEYRIVQIYSRDRGKREAKLSFDVGQGTQDEGFRNELAVLFECAPAVQVTLEVRDVDGSPTTGQFVIRDRHGRVYPARSRRLAPDFFFHDQIYRHHGETVALPPGDYEVVYTRGPEYKVLRRTMSVPAAAEHREKFQLERWIRLTDYRWYSGDHHVHAAGCGHYESPTQGVGPADMMRHILGEDLNVGCVLSWGPCWYFQKQFFSGGLHQLSTKDHLMRYDIEVSGFPSSHAGHLCLLRLTEDDYPGTTKIEEWPSWDLPVLQWGKKQGGVVGFSHSGWGLQIPGDHLPNYNLPKFDGIGANEYVVDVVHDACDFISAVDTPIVWELNIWYHTLNCGYPCRISGETDFPCIYGDRVGLGRIYVKLPADQPLDFDRWVQGLKDGRSYCGDGLSHLIDFQVGGLEVGQPGDRDRASFLAARSGQKLPVKVKAAALLEERPREEIRSKPLDQKPYWHVERARVGDSNKVPVELIVNGLPVARKEIVADGRPVDVEFDLQLERSSWVAVRIFPSSHTNPVFVELDGRPIRASKRSAQWCLDSVDICWKQKEPRIRAEEKPAAAAAYDVARKAYATILSEAFDDRPQAAPADDARLLDDTVGVIKVASDCKFTEGPAVDARGDLYFSDGPNDRIVRRTADGRLSDFRKPCGRANGLAFDREGRLTVCQSGGRGGGRRVVRLEADGRETVLAAEYDGKPFNAPNDLCVDRKGRIYFTDPNFGDPAEAQQKVAGVYRIDEPGQVRLVIADLQKPNGIVLTPDGGTLYVSDRGTQKLHRYRVSAEGDLTPDGVLYDFSPDRGVDGMRLDERGNVWAAAGKDATTGLFVVSPQGKLLLHKPMPEFSTNLAFGGPDGRDLYFTASTSVYKLRTLVAGAK